MKRLYVLYDAYCGVCSWARRWAQDQPAIVPLEFIRADSEEARRLFPTLASQSIPEELIVVSDEGAVYREDGAWIMCLYALEEFRSLSLRLASPQLLPFARHAFLVLSKRRRALSRLLGLVSDRELLELLWREPSTPRCSPGGAR